MVYHRKLLFRNWALPLDKRCQLFEPLVLSKLLYGAETWVVTEEGTARYFHAAAIRLYRRLLPAPAGRHLADVEIMSKVGLPSPIDLLRPYFIVEAGKGLLACDAWWTSLIEEDMAWMWQQVRNSSHLLDPRQHWAACEETSCCITAPTGDD